MKQRTILYSEQQMAAMNDVTDAGVELMFARESVGDATVRVRAAIRRALLLGIHYKELTGVSKSFAYRVLKEIEKEQAA